MKALTRESSKEDEIAFLRSVAEQVAGKDLYLSSLFSAEFLKELEHRIHGDLDTDLMPYVQKALTASYDQRQAVETAVAAYVREAQKREAEIKDLEEAAALQTQSVDRLVAELREANDGRRELSRQLYAAEKKLAALAELVKNAWFAGKEVAASALREVLA